MHVVVAGAGYTGRRVLSLAAGASVISRTRRPGFSDRRYLVRNLDEETIDAIDLSAPYSLLYTIPPPNSGTSDPRLERLLLALTTTPARIVYLSTSGVYGDHGGALIDETTVPNPASPRGRRRFAAEKLLLEYCARNGCETTILRVPGIYGPYRLGIQRLRERQAQIRESDSNPGNRIHVDDLAACCLAAIDPECQAGVFNVGDGDYRSATCFASRVAELAGLDPPPLVSRREAERSFSPRRLSFLRESRRLDLTRMRERLGFEPHYGDPDLGIRASLREEGIPIVDQG